MFNFSCSGQDIHTYHKHALFYNMAVLSIFYWLRVKTVWNIAIVWSIDMKCYAFHIMTVLRVHLGMWYGPVMQNKSVSKTKERSRSTQRHILRHDERLWNNCRMKSRATSATRPTSSVQQTLNERNNSDHVVI